MVCKQKDSDQQGPPAQPFLNSHLPRGEISQGKGKGKAAQLLWPEPLSYYLEMTLPPAAGGQRADDHGGFQ